MSNNTYNQFQKIPENQFKKNDRNSTSKKAKIQKKYKNSKYKNAIEIETVEL